MDAGQVVSGSVRGGVAGAGTGDGDGDGDEDGGADWTGTGAGAGAGADAGAGTNIDTMAKDTDMGIWGTGTGAGACEGVDRIVRYVSGRLSLVGGRPMRMGGSGTCEADSASVPTGAAPPPPAEEDMYAAPSVLSVGVVFVWGSLL